jgi:hypothetical protein
MNRRIVDEQKEATRCRRRRREAEARVTELTEALEDLLSVADRGTFDQDEIHAIYRQCERARRALGQSS